MDTSRLAFPLATATAFPVIIVGERLMLGADLPVGALTVMAGAYAMGLVWAAMSLGLVAKSMTVSHASGALAGERLLPEVAKIPGLALAYTAAPPAVAYTAAVAGVSGACPWGLKVADTFEIDATGRLSAPPCKAALEVLTPVWTRRAPERDSRHRLDCACPLADRRVKFAVYPSPPAPVSRRAGVPPNQPA